MFVAPCSNDLCSEHHRLLQEVRLQVSRWQGAVFLARLSLRQGHANLAASYQAVDSALAKQRTSPLFRELQRVCFGCGPEPAQNFYGWVLSSRWQEGNLGSDEEDERPGWRYDIQLDDPHLPALTLRIAEARLRACR